MNQLPDMTGLFIALGVLCAVGGWVVIEGLLWLGSHITLSLV